MLTQANKKIDFADYSIFDPTYIPANVVIDTTWLIIESIVDDIKSKYGEG